MRLKLDVQVASTQPNLPATPTIKHWAKTALAERVEKTIALGVRLVDDVESAQLNQRYRQKTGATNVLSFPCDPLPHITTCFLGDLVICAPVVQAEARAQNKPETAHWAHMVIHGILHLCGYDHIDDHDASIMEAKEANILERLGFNDPYSAD